MRREERRLRVFENMVLRTIFGPKGDEVTGSGLHPRAAFLKLWSADHKWSSGSALVVLLD